MLAHVRRLGRARGGNVLIETALVAGMLGFLAIGAIDFGRAYVRQSEIDNAVRAGLQFALARHPTTQEIVEGLVSIQSVRDRVVEAADFLDTDPGDPPLSASFLCECADGTPLACGDIPPPSCDRRTMVTVTLAHDYEMFFNYPGLGDRMSLRGEGVIRLN